MSFMKNTNLFNILRTFSAEELKLFESFICCYMFNRRSKKVTELFTSMKKFLPVTSEAEISKIQIWEIMYPGRKYSDEVIRNLISDLFQLSKKFLIHLRVSNDKVESGKILSQELYDRKIKNLLLKEIESTETYIKNNIRSVESRFIDMYILDCIKNIALNRELEYKDYKEQQHRIMELVNYFLKEMMAYYQNYEILKTFIKTEYEMILFDELMTFADMNHKIIDPEVILMFNTTVLVIYPEKEDVFKKTLKLVKQKGNSIERFSHYNILVSLENYCLNKYNKGDTDYIKYLYEIYEEKIKYDVLSPTVTGTIVESTFTNIVKTGIRTGKFTWTENFIRNNFHRLQENEDDMLNYYLAYIFHSKGDNGKALQHLSKLRAQDMMEKINVKNLEMKIYFELGYYDNVLMTADTYKHFFSGNKKISDSRKAGHLNFIDLTLKLLRATEKNDKVTLGFLAKKIKNTSPVAEKDWLLSKLKK